MVLLLLFMSRLAAALRVSPPTGKWRLVSSTMELIDQNRPDPWTESPESRRLMLSVFHPVASHEVCHLQTHSYMPPATASFHDDMYSELGIPEGMFESLDVEFCRNKPRPWQDFPVVIFSPGLGNSRLLYNAMAMALSSQGFIVVTVDHPYDASIVEYPDGSVVRAANISSDEQITEALKTRRADVEFVVDRVLDAPWSLSPSARKILVHGHSLGGATAAAAMMKDSRILGGINLDGSLFDPFIEPGVDCPFMLMGHENKTLETDSSWARVWPRMRSTKVALEVSGFLHGTFTDLPLLAETLGVGDGLSHLLGTVNGSRAVEIVTANAASFFRFAVGSTQEPVDGIVQEKYLESKVLQDVRRGRCCR